MGKRQQRTINNLTLVSKLRNMIKKDSEATLDMSTEMRWQKHNNVSRKLYSTKTYRARTVLCPVVSLRKGSHGKSVSH